MKNTESALHVNPGKTRTAENVHTADRKPAERRSRAFVAAFFCSALALLVLAAPVAAQAPQDQLAITQSPELEAGFHLLYELKPAEARAQFEGWQQSHPEDPLGPALQAANYLLEACYRQGVLTSEFFLDDKRVSSKNAVKPDPEQRAAFIAAYQHALDLARARLKTEPHDVNALFAISMSLGMQADYAALIDKHQAESLGMMKDSSKYAAQLLAINPEVSDAYLALGAANYIVGSLSGPQRFFLGFKGIHGDEKEGIRQLEIAATHGHDLRPFAKMLLALAELRLKKPDLARTQLSELAQEFPANPLFASELAKLSARPAAPDVQKTGP